MSHNGRYDDYTYELKSYYSNHLGKEETINDFWISIPIIDKEMKKKYSVVCVPLKLFLFFEVVDMEKFVKNITIIKPLFLGKSINDMRFNIELNPHFVLNNKMFIHFIEQLNIIDPKEKADIPNKELFSFSTKLEKRYK
jgi:hypothetical protein